MTGLRSPNSERIAEDLGVRTNLLESVDERRQSWMEEAIQGGCFRPGPPPGNRARPSRMTWPVPGPGLPIGQEKRSPPPRAIVRQR
jgi:hypothetical protein